MLSDEETALSYISNKFPFGLHKFSYVCLYDFDALPYDCHMFLYDVHMFSYDCLMSW